MTEEELIKLSTIHEVLSAGDDILKAQVLLKNQLKPWSIMQVKSQL